MSITGNRDFVCNDRQDNPDKNLCRDVCAERVRRVLGGCTNAKGQTVTGLGGGFASLYHVIHVVAVQALRRRRLESLDYLRAPPADAPMWSGMDAKLRDALIAGAGAGAGGLSGKPAAPDMPA